MVPSLKVTFSLRPDELDHFSRIMSKAVSAAHALSEEMIVRAAFEMMDHARGADPPDYVLSRLEKLTTIVRMTQDRDWKLPETVKQRILAVIHYFTKPDDLIPDHIPGLGFLDDAIMIELVARQLRHELSGFEDFDRFRRREEERPWHVQGRVTREKKIAERRDALRARILKREARDLARSRDGGHRFRFW